MTTTIAKEYAEALYELSLENHHTEEVFNCLKIVVSLFEENPDYPILLSSPAIPKKERLALLEQAFSNQLPEELVSFLAILVKRGDVDQLAASADDFEKLYNRDRGILSAEIISAKPLSPEQKSALEKKLSTLTQKVIQAVYRTDESLIGGLVIHLDGHTLDGSLKNKINMWKEVMQE
jgi:F-type H+-transporting ATPase subunit delta